ncbi:Uncharacterised protein [Canicola haemoglobinophilus]|uniref:Uncharacterized protein n=1 Tax=Canicola haemoglobinophilus TaxID=733 RepID=A0AB38H867_9PAST|nr:hypothetical protein [Canicola haemoglobinophilus]STO53899.1 Uncharacterised protein [Canicola haemoglobinophilus]STO68432.1 Uncharacterised protein [Canicola haemoglobinophilus]
MAISRKMTLLLPTFKGENDDLKHLYFILTDPCFDYEQNRPEMLLLVNCSSIKEGRVYDDACVLTAGEHSFIVKDSFIFYQEMRIESLFNIEKA